LALSLEFTLCQTPPLNLVMILLIECLRISSPITEDLTQLSRTTSSDLASSRRTLKSLLKFKRNKTWPHLELPSSLTGLKKNSSQFLASRSQRLQDLSSIPMLTDPSQERETGKTLVMESKIKEAADHAGPSQPLGLLSQEQDLLESNQLLISLNNNALIVTQSQKDAMEDG